MNSVKLDFIVRKIEWGTKFRLVGAKWVVDLATGESFVYFLFPIFRPRFWSSIVFGFYIEGALRFN